MMRLVFAQARMTQRYGKPIPLDTDYANIATLSLEAREKLALVRLPAAAALLCVLCPACLQFSRLFVEIRRYGGLSACKNTHAPKAGKANTQLGHDHAPSRLACMGPSATVQQERVALF